MEGYGLTYIVVSGKILERTTVNYNCVINASQQLYRVSVAVLKFINVYRSCPRIVNAFLRIFRCTLSSRIDFKSLCIAWCSCKSVASAYNTYGSFIARFYPLVKDNINRINIYQYVILSIQRIGSFYMRSICLKLPIISPCVLKSNRITCVSCNICRPHKHLSLGSYGK